MQELLWFRYIHIVAYNSLDQSAWLEVLDEHILTVSTVFLDQGRPSLSAQYGWPCIVPFSMLLLAELLLQALPNCLISLVARWYGPMNRGGAIHVCWQGFAVTESPQFLLERVEFPFGFLRMDQS